jgi:hypothetical protein
MCYKIYLTAESAKQRSRRDIHTRDCPEESEKKRKDNQDRVSQDSISVTGQTGI